MTTAEVTKKLYSFLDEHRQLIKYAKKGYIQRLCDAFKQECGYDKSPRWMSKALYTYRIVRDVPIEYCENKYYTSVQKMNAQATHTATTQAEEQASDQE